MLELIVIDLYRQYRTRPACTSVQSDQALYSWLTNLISLKMIKDSSNKSTPCRANTRLKKLVKKGQNSKKI